MDSTSVLPAEAPAKAGSGKTFSLGMRVIATVLVVLPFVWVALMDSTVHMAPVFWFRTSDLTPTFFYCWPAAWACYAMAMLPQISAGGGHKRLVISFLLMLGAVCLGMLSSKDLEKNVLRAIGLRFPTSPTEITDLIRRDVMPALRTEYKQPILTQFTEVEMLDDPRRMSMIYSRVCEKTEAADRHCKILKVAVAKDGTILGSWLAAVQ